MDSIGRGFWSGVLATSTMTLALIALWRASKPLPPAQLTDDVLSDFGAEPPDDDARAHATMLAHYGFGITTAVIYSLLLTSSARKPNPALAGLAYGSAVWTGSYLGDIPAFGFRPSAPRLTTKQNIVMVLAHWVWGLILAYSDRELGQRGRLLLDGARDRR